MTQTDNDQYWPFQISEEDNQLPEKAEKIEFLESTYSEGFEAYRESGGLDFYGAKSKSRSGYIMQRARRNRWEFVLSENGDERLTAFVTNFKVAGTAVRAWLNERSVSDILDDVNGYLTIPPGLKFSYAVYDVEPTS
jgi:hypothetical protein